MPITQVKAPDGTIVKVQHPDGATEDEIVAYAQAQYQPDSGPKGMPLDAPFPQGYPTPHAADVAAQEGLFTGTTPSPEELAQRRHQEAVTRVEAGDMLRKMNEPISPEQHAAEQARLDEIKSGEEPSLASRPVRGLTNPGGTLLRPPEGPAYGSLPGLGAAAKALGFGLDITPEQQAQMDAEAQGLNPQSVLAGPAAALRGAVPGTELPSMGRGAYGALQGALEGVGEFGQEIPAFAAGGQVAKEIKAGKVAGAGVTFGVKSFLEGDSPTKVFREFLIGLGFGGASKLSDAAVEAAAKKIGLEKVTEHAMKVAASAVTGGAGMTAVQGAVEGKVPTGKDFLQNEFMSVLFHTKEGISALHTLATESGIESMHKERKAEREATTLKLDKQEYADTKSQRLPGYDIKPGAAARFIIIDEEGKRKMEAGTIEGFSTSVTLPDGRKTPHKVLLRDGNGELHAVGAESVIPVSEGTGAENKSTPLAVAEAEAKLPPADRFAKLSNDAVQDLAKNGDPKALAELDRRRGIATKRKVNQPTERRTSGADASRIAHVLGQDPDVREVVKKLRAEGLDDTEIAAHPEMIDATGLRRGEDKQTRYLSAQAVGPLTVAEQMSEKLPTAGEPGPVGVQEGLPSQGIPPFPLTNEASGTTIDPTTQEIANVAGQLGEQPTTGSEGVLPEKGPAVQPEQPAGQGNAVEQGASSLRPETHSRIDTLARAGHYSEAEGARLKDSIAALPGSARAAVEAKLADGTIEIYPWSDAEKLPKAYREAGYKAFAVTNNKTGVVKIYLPDTGEGVDHGTLRHELAHALYPDAPRNAIEEGVARAVDVGRQILALAQDILHGTAPSFVEERFGQVAEAVGFMHDDMAKVHEKHGPKGVKDYVETLLAQAEGLSDLSDLVNEGELPPGGDTSQFLMMATLKAAAEDLGVTLPQSYHESEPTAYLAGADPAFFDRLGGKAETPAESVPEPAEVQGRVFTGPTDEEVEDRIKNWRSPAAQKSVQEGLGPVRPFKKGGKVVHATGNVTPALAWTMIKNTLTDGEIAKARTWYHDIPKQFEKVFPDKEEAKQALIAWALTQQNTSPSGGFQALQRVKDKIFGGERNWSYEYAPGSLTRRAERIGKPIKGGVAAEKVEKFLTSQEIASDYSKIPDFRNAVIGDLTRDYFKNDPRGGMPAPFDVWAMRARGHVDDVVRAAFGLKRRAGEPIGKDPRGALYEEGNIYYQRLADYLSKKTGEKWLPSEAQAVDWVRVQKAMGTQPEAPEDIIKGSTYGVNTEHLPESASHIEDAAKLTGVTLVPNGVEVGTGRWVNSEGQIETEPSIHVQIVGSNEAVRDFLDTVGYKARQTETIAAKPALSGDTPGIDVMFNSPLDDAAQDKFFAALKDEMPGFFTNNGAGPAMDPDGRRGFRMLNMQPVEGYTPDGKPIFGKRTPWKAKDIAQLAGAAKKVAGQLGYDSDIDVVPGNFEVIRERNEWREPKPANRDLFAGPIPFHPEGENYTAALRGRQRPQIADALERERASQAGEGTSTAAGAEGQPSNPQAEPGRISERGPVTQLADSGAGEMGDDSSISPRISVQQVAHALKTTQRAIRTVMNAGSASPEAAEAGRSLRDKLGHLARERDAAGEALKKSRKLFKKMGEADRLDFYDRVETRKPQATPELDSIAQVFRRVLDKAWLDVANTGKIHSYISDFMPHLYKEFSKANEFFGKRPLQPNRFTKERKFTTLKEAMNYGLTPLTTNPAEAVMMQVMQMNKFVMAEKLLNEFEQKGLAQKSVPGSNPSGWETIRNHNLAMPREVARIINRYLDPGIRGTDWKHLYNAYMGLSNGLNMVQLGLSAYHGTMSTITAAASDTVNGLFNIIQGKPVKGMGQMGRGMLVAPSVAHLLSLGSKVSKEWLRPGTQGGDIPMIVEMAQRAGHRIGMENEWQTKMATKYHEALQETFGKGRSLKERAFGGVGGPAIGGALRVASPLHAAGAILDLAARPIMNYYVPLLKNGVMADMIRLELDRLGPNATYEAQRAAVQRSQDQVDDRLGQLAYDNLHWSRTFRDLSMAAVRAVGWNIGDLRTGLGAFKDLANVVPKLMKGSAARRAVGERLFTQRMAFSLVYPIQMGLMGGLMYYMYHGKRPEKLEDYYHVPTGEIGDDGLPVKKEIAGYMKDLFSYTGTKWMGGTANPHPLQTLVHKQAPLMSLMAEMLKNRDYYDTKIRNEDDPIVKQVQDMFFHVAQSPIPISIKNMMQEKAGGSPMSTREKLEPFFGITPVRKEYMRTVAENLLKDYTEERLTKGGRTSEQAKQSLEKSHALGQLRRGNQDPLVEYATKYGLTPAEVISTVKEGTGDQFVERLGRIDLDKGFRVWAVATPEEKAKMRLPMLKRLIKVLHKSPTKGKIYYDAAQRAGFFNEEVPAEVFNQPDTEEDTTSE